MAGNTILFIFQPIGSIPEVGAKNHRILQTLGTMHGDNLDGLFIAFQTQLSTFFSDIGFHHSSQPQQGLDGLKMFTVFCFLNKFKQMLNISKTPFSPLL